MKKILRPLCVSAVLTFVAAGGALFTLSRDSVQEKIAVALLRSRGVEASFGSWRSRAFSDFELDDVVLRFDDGQKLILPRARVRANVPAALFGAAPEADFEAAEGVRLSFGGAAFTIAPRRCAFSAAADGRCEFVGSVARADVPDAEPVAFAFESENRDAPQRAFEPLAWLAGTRRARAEIAGVAFESDGAGAWKLSSAPDAPCPVSGSGTFGAEKFSGKIEAAFASEALRRFGFLRETPRMRGRAALDVSCGGNTRAVGFSCDVRLEELAGSFAGVSFLPDADLRARGALEFSGDAFSVGAFFASLSAVADGVPPVVLAEISLPEAFSVAFADGLKFSAGGDDDALAYVKFNDVPLPLLNPFLARKSDGNAAALRVESGVLAGTLKLTRGADGAFALAGDEPLRARDLALSKAGRTLWRGFSASVPVRLDARADELALNCAEARLFDDAGTLVGGLSAHAARDFRGGATRLEGSVSAEPAAFRRGAFAELFSDVKERELALRSEFDAEIASDGARVKRFAFALSELGENAATLLSATTDPFELAPDDPFAGLAGKEIALRASAFPLCLLNLLSDGKFRFSGTLDGEIEFVGEKDSVEFSTRRKGMTIRDFAMAEADGAPLLRGLSLRSDDNFVGVSRDESGHFATAVDLKNARLKGADGTAVASGDLSLRFAGKKLTVLCGDVSGSLAELPRQPMFAENVSVAAGTFALHGVLDASDARAKFSAELRGLRSRDAEVEPPRAVTLELTHGEAAAGGDAARLVVETEGEGRSRVLARFSRLDFDRRNGVTRFDASVNAPKIYAEDFLALARTFSPPRAKAGGAATALSVATAGELAKRAAVPADAAEPVPAPAVPPRSEPVSAKTAAASPAPWAAFAGKAKFRVGELVVPENVIRGLEGEASADAHRLALSASSRTFFDGTFALNASLEARGRSPFFVAETRAEIRDAHLCDAVPALRGKNPPPAEGVFAVDFSSRAEADSPDALPDAFAARARISGREGRMRIFAAGDERAQLVGGLANVGGSMVGLLGDLAGGLSSRARRTAKALSRLQRDLADFPFDELDMELSARAGEPIRCEKFLLRNDMLRISGTGEINYDGSCAFGDSPLRIGSRIDVRGDLEELLSTLRVLRDEDGARDGDGYARGPEFEMTGTLNHFSHNLLESLLASAPAFLKKE
ncbi:MAG: hypothetical protein ACI4QA_00900 [Candidatus Spyradosoma sp.]